MRLEQIRDLLDARLLAGQCDLEAEVTHAFAADLMSDVLALAGPGTLLLTGLTNPQVVRTSEVAGVTAIVFVRGKHALPETEELAREAGIPLFRTDLKMFDACGRLYQAGLRGTV
ncbi:MAG: hypothetical protein ACM3US_04615 [Sphingomonadaceae bacterium]